MFAKRSLKDLLDVAIDAAYLAGRRTLAYFNADVAVETKSDDTPVTRADREAETLIRERVSRFFPDHCVLGEEHGETKGNPDYKWLIDPIDGTKSFIHGVPLYGVLIGVEVRGRPSVGVIYAPATDELVAAADGLGCMWNGRTARVSQVSRIEDATLLSSSITRSIARSDAYSNLSSRAKLNRGWGDAYGYMLVATGRADIMLDPVINPWDCAPFPPIFREAGGRYTTWAGEETIWGPDGCATNGALNQQVLDVLRAEKRKPGADMSID
jgi:histidinol-phosphatase